jgi:hypothetical protein
MSDIPSEFHDEGAGPEESDDVLADPENQAAAAAIRDSTIEDGELEMAAELEGEG